MEHGVADDQEPLSCRIDHLKDNLLRPSEGDDAHIWAGPDQFDGLPLSMVPLGKSGCEECDGNGLRQDAPGLRMPPIEEADQDRPVVGAREGRAISARNVPQSVPSLRPRRAMTAWTTGNGSAFASRHASSAIRRYASPIAAPSFTVPPLPRDRPGPQYHP